MCIGVMVVCAGFEVGMIFALRPAYERGQTSGVKAFGVLFSVLVAVGLLPEYYEIWKKKEVIGISVTFMLIDAAGGIFSDLSLAFAPEFDITAAVGYTLVTAMDMVVIVAALILNPRANRRRRLIESNEPSMENVQDQQSVTV
ncbi:pq loop repeat protein [Moniliophthora roreri]|nr:pq loop repeat protein [Moniliophthora roreri]